MPVLVPTLEEFQALEKRVIALEQTRPEIPGDGTQARRIAHLIESFGVNTFSSMDEHNVWGSWPALYTPQSVAAGLNWIRDGSGFTFLLREYHYEGREQHQGPWFKAIQALLPDSDTVLCVGGGGQLSAVPSLIELSNDHANGIKWCQGLNEPNTDFGSGMIGIEQTLAIQLALHDRSPLPVLGPPIVAGMPHPQGWVEGYAGDRLDALNAAMALGSGHYYPPRCPDIPGDDTSVRAYLEGLQRAYKQGVWLTEFHPSLFAEEHQCRPGQPQWDGNRDAYYTLLTLLRCAELDVKLWWFALYDYGQTYTCGLYPREAARDPRPVAKALRTLCVVCADHGDRHGFTPGKLPVTVHGLGADGSWSLYQASDGRFFLILWRSAQEWGGASVPVDISFARPMAEVTEYDLLIGSSLAVNQYKTVRQVPCNLDASVRCFVVQTD